MEFLSLKKVSIIIVALLLCASLSKGIDQCDMNSKSHTLITSISCDPSSDDVPPLPVICPGNHDIPLPNIIQYCHPTDRIWSGVNCYHSDNIANKLVHRDVQISDLAIALVDGSPKTYINVSNTDHELPSSWHIFLGRQYAVYAIYVVFLNQIPPSDTVEVQTRHRTNGTINGFLDIPCRRAAQASGSLFQRRRFVFYCPPNSNIDNGQRTNEHQQLIGRMAQNILVTVNTLQVLRLAEIEVYENQGLECGTPSQPWETIYGPIKAYYSVGDEVVYSCRNSSFYLFGSSTRHCGSDGRWVGHAPLCREIFLLKNDSFESNSIIRALMDGSDKSCFPLGKSGDMITANQSVGYEIRLKNRPIIGQIHIDISGTLNDCKIEIPSHPNIVFVLNNKSETIISQDRITTMVFVPRISVINEDGSICLIEEVNPAHLIQFFVESKEEPLIILKCALLTVVCELRILEVQDVTNRCGLPETPIHSQLKITTEIGLENAIYSCDSGFTLFNSNGVRSCNDGRQWDRPPICQRVNCRLYPPSNVTDSDGIALVWRLTPNSIDPGSIARYFYRDGSVPSPSIVWECDSEGHWVDASASNQPKSISIIWIVIICAPILFIIILVVLFLILRHRRNRLRAQRGSDQMKGKSTINNLAQHPYQNRNQVIPYRRNDAAFRRNQLELNSIALSPRPPLCLP